MIKPSKNKKKLPWQKISIIVLILFMITGIYIIKNVIAANENNQNTQANVTTDTNNALPKLVDLGSTTCIPCKEMAPILADLKNEYKGKLEVEVVDVNEDRTKTMEYNEKHAIRVIPTQILFDATGKEVWSHEGSLSKEELVKVFKEKVGVN